MRHIYKFLATGCYTGLCPIAPGTAGTLVGVLAFYFLGHMTQATYLVTLVAFIFLSIWVADKAVAIFDTEDPKEVVIDEIAGYLVTMAFHGVNIHIMIAGFVLFRIFDIAKPFPIGAIDRRIGGGVGIVLDDVLAGVYANAALWLLIWIAWRMGFASF